MDMYIEIDFSSDEALYIQLRNQIILGIATNRFHEGDVLPSVRQLADTIGINMHTVNKAYTVLKQEGYVKVEEEKARLSRLTRERSRLCWMSGMNSGSCWRRRAARIFPGKKCML